MSLVVLTLFLAAEQSSGSRLDRGLPSKIALPSRHNVKDVPVQASSSHSDGQDDLQTRGGPKANAGSRIALRAFKRATSPSRVDARVDSSTGYVRYAHFHPRHRLLRKEQLFFDHETVAMNSLKTFLIEHADAFGISDASNDSLSLHASHLADHPANDALRDIRIIVQQEVGNIAMFGGRIIAHMQIEKDPDSSHSLYLLSLHGNFFPSPSIVWGDIARLGDPKSATQAAIDHVHRVFGPDIHLTPCRENQPKQSQDRMRTTIPDIQVSIETNDTALDEHGTNGSLGSATGPELIIFPTGLLQTIEGESVHAYQVCLEEHPKLGPENDRDRLGNRIHAQPQDRHQVLIGVSTGQVLHSWQEGRGLLYRNIYKPDNNTLSWQEGYPLPTEEGTQSALATAEEVYNLMASLSGGEFLSWDGESAPMTMVIRPSALLPAQWLRPRVYLTPNISAADDVVGHEWGHAIVDSTANFVPSFQSGALAEGYATIVGEGKRTKKIITPMHANDRDIYTFSSPFTYLTIVYIFYCKTIHHNLPPPNTSSCGSSEPERIRQLWPQHRFICAHRN